MFSLFFFSFLPSALFYFDLPATKVYCYLYFDYYIEKGLWQITVSLASGVVQCGSVQSVAWQCFVSVSVINRSCRFDPDFQSSDCPFPFRQYLNTSSVNNRKDPVNCEVSRKVIRRSFHLAESKVKLTLLGIKTFGTYTQILMKINEQIFTQRRRTVAINDQNSRSNLISNRPVSANFNQQCYVLNLNVN